MTDYKELIEKLRRYAEAADENIYGICINSPQAMTQAAEAIEQLMKERDAAVDDLKQISDCDYCKWFVGYECTDLEHETCDEEYWEWRGIQDETD